MSLNHDALTRRAVLLILNDCATYLFPEDALYQQAVWSIRPAPTRAEFHSILDALEADDLASAITDQVTKLRKWHITDRGKLALADG